MLFTIKISTKFWTLTNILYFVMWGWDQQDNAACQWMSVRQPWDALQFEWLWVWKSQVLNKADTMAGNSESRSQFSGLALPYSSVCLDNKIQGEKHWKVGEAKEWKLPVAYALALVCVYNGMRHTMCMCIPSINGNYVSSHILHHYITQSNFIFCCTDKHER